MMYEPSLFDESFDTMMDDMMNEFNREWNSNVSPLFGRHASNMMKTDIQENNNNYVLNVDLPGFDKNEMKVSLDNGYLTIHAEKALDKDNKDKKSGRMIRQERYGGMMERSFYVGDQYKNEDISAKYENGVLTITLPKKDQKQVEENNYIRIA